MFVSLYICHTFWSIFDLSNLFQSYVPLQKKMYSCLIILNSILAFSYSYLLVDKNESLSLIFAENNHSRRAVAIYPPNWNFTTVSPDDLPPYNKYLQPGKPRLTFGFHIEQMRTVSEIEKIFSFDAIATVWSGFFTTIF